jgi:hypothetical protein
MPRLLNSPNSAFRIDWVRLVRLVRIFHIARHRLIHADLLLSALQLLIIIFDFFLLLPNLSLLLHLLIFFFTPPLLNLPIQLFFHLPSFSFKLNLLIMIEFL